jgi:hypothetical protein
MENGRKLAITAMVEIKKVARDQLDVGHLPLLATILLSASTK